MSDQIAPDASGTTRRSKGLIVATSVFGLPYLWFIIVSFIPAPEGTWVSNTVPFDPFDLEQVLVKALFGLFLIGCWVLWKSELLGGVLFIVWWVAMGFTEIFVISRLKPDTGGGIVMGFPLLVIGILYVRHGMMMKRRAAMAG